MAAKLVAAALVAMAGLAGAAFAEPGPAPSQCEAVSFRVYFEPEATNLNETARELIAVAARDVAGCADVNVSMTPAQDGDAYASALRSMAIASEMRGYGIDVDVAMPHLARYTTQASAGPAYIQVRMTPDMGLAS